jgi:hypothetical protein
VLFLSTTLALEEAPNAFDLVSSLRSVRRYAAVVRWGLAKFAVRFRVPLIEVGRLMGDMRVWLDRRGVVPAAFHCQDMSDGVEVDVSFDKRADATGCAIEFEGYLSPLDEVRDGGVASYRP